MGRTGAFTTLRDEHGEWGVAITDREAFEEHRDEMSMDPITNWEYEDEEAYPRVERQVLYGYNANTSDDDDKFYIGNLHMLRDEDAFREFWGRVSSYCEPFVLLHAEAQGHFPDVTKVVREEKPTGVFRVEAADGELDIVKFDLAATRE